MSTDRIVNYIIISNTFIRRFLCDRDKQPNPSNQQSEKIRKRSNFDKLSSFSKVDPVAQLGSFAIGIHMFCVYIFFTTLPPYYLILVSRFTIASLCLWHLSRTWLKLFAVWTICNNALCLDADFRSVFVLSCWKLFVCDKGEDIVSISR